MNSNSPSLHRHVGLIALILYGVGDILGAGIYGLIGRAAGQMGHSVWLAFLASMVVAGLTGLSYASLGSRYPRAAGAAYFTLRGFNRVWLSYFVGLAVLASGLTSMATATRVFSGYLHNLLGSTLPIPILIIGFAVALAVVVFIGIRESMWANAVCTIIELLGLVIIVLVGFKYIGMVDYFDARTINNPEGLLTPSLILSGAVLTFYSFVGFEDMINISEEVKSPERNIPIGLISAVVISSAIYMLISVIAVSVVPPMELAASNQPLVDVVAKAAPWLPTPLYSLVALFAVANTALLNFVMGSRLVYGMSEQKLLPHFLAHVNAKTRTPQRAIIVLLVLLLLLALSGDISALAKATSVLLLICFTVVNLALLRLKLNKSEPRGRFEVPIFVPLLGAITCVVMLFHAGQPELITSGLILIGITILYFVKKPKSI